jgi:elongation factor Ts
VDISADRVKQLRERSGAGVMDCKRALVESGGDLERALEILREHGLAQVAKRAGREASQGVVEAYVHGGGRIGVLVEVNCETDFVARTPDFRELAHDLALQIAATNPPAVDADESVAPFATADVPLDQVPLLLQPSIKNSSRTIAEIVRDTAAKTGENIVVRRFTRFELGT